MTSAGHCLQRSNANGDANASITGLQGPVMDMSINGTRFHKSDLEDS